MPNEIHTLNLPLLKYISMVMLLFSILVVIYWYRRRINAFRKVQTAIQKAYKKMLTSHREEFGNQDSDKIDPYQWLQGQTNENVTAISRTIPEMQTIEAVTEDNTVRLVVSPLSPSTIGKQWRRYRKGRGKISSIVELPLLRTDLPGKFFPLLGIQHYNEGLSHISPTFDLEIETVGEAFGVDWSSIDRLWFYRIPSNILKTKFRKGL